MSPDSGEDLVVRARNGVAGLQSHPGVFTSQGIAPRWAVGPVPQRGDLPRATMGPPPAPKKRSSSTMQRGAQERLHEDHRQSPCHLGGSWTPCGMASGAGRINEVGSSHHHHRPSAPDQVTLCFVGLPVRSVVASGMQVDELVRDIQLHQVGDSALDTDDVDRLFDHSADVRFAGRPRALRAAAASRTQSTLIWPPHCPPSGVPGNCGNCSASSPVATRSSLPPWTRRSPTSVSGSPSRSAANCPVRLRGRARSMRRRLPVTRPQRGCDPLTVRAAANGPATGS